MFTVARSIPSATMILASLMLLALFERTAPCQQASLRVEAELSSVDYFVDVLAETPYCTRIIAALLDETIKSFTMHYVWFNNKRTINSVTYSEYGYVDNATPYKCWHSASSQIITCLRMNYQLCVNTMSDLSCCSHSNAILWNTNEEYVYSSDLFNFTSSCRAEFIVRYLVFYALKAPSLTSTNTIKVSTLTPHHLLTSLISTQPTTPLAKDTGDPPTGLIIGLTVGLALVILIGILAFIFWKKRKSINIAKTLSNNGSAPTNSNQESNGRFFNVYHNIPILRRLPLFRKKDFLKTSVRYQNPGKVSEDHDKNTTPKNSQIVDTNLQANTYEDYTTIDYNCSKPRDDQLSDRDYQNSHNNTKQNSDFKKHDHHIQPRPNKDLNSQQIQKNQRLDQIDGHIHDYEIIDGNVQQIEDSQHNDPISKVYDNNEIINHDLKLTQTYSNTDLVDGIEYSTIDQTKGQQDTEETNETKQLASKTHDKTKPYARLGNQKTCFSNPYNGGKPEESTSPTYFVLESSDLGPYSLAHTIT